MWLLYLLGESTCSGHVTDDNDNIAPSKTVDVTGQLIDMDGDENEQCDSTGGDKDADDDNGDDMVIYNDICSDGEDLH